MRVKDKLNMLFFITDTTGGICTMALGDEAVGSDGQDIGDDSVFGISLSTNDLTAEIEELNAALANQDKLLRLAACEKKYFKYKYESTLRELESARALVMVSDETKCYECALHMSNITTLQTRYTTMLDERDELRSKSSLLCACIACSGL
jgi:hypothetical protein